MYSKKEIRELIQIKKNQMTEEEMIMACKKCRNRLYQLEEYKHAELLFLYVDFNKEMQTKAIITDALKAGKRIAVPKVEKKEMNFYEINSLDHLSPSNFGILEPIDTITPVYGSALMIMPGIAFDTCRNRIGYGGGFYDRYLEEHPYNKTIAIAYDFQILENLPADIFDKKPDKIVTDQRIIE